MLHYTLLPKEEIKSLRTEYRIRFFIIALFFISSSVVIGILALFPSLVVSLSQENTISQKTTDLQKKLQESGADQIEKDLKKSQTISEKILVSQSQVSYSDAVQKIISHRVAGVTLASFDMSYTVGTSTPIETVIQGKASTREALIAFKSSVEADKSFTNVELPISDLAKSRDVSFAMRILIKRN